MYYLVWVQYVNTVHYIHINYDIVLNPVYVMNVFLLLWGYPNRMNDYNWSIGVYHNVLMVLYIDNCLSCRVRLGRLHDQDFFLWIVCTIFVLQFLILVDKYNLFYCSMMLDVLYLNGFDDELFLSMYEIHPKVYVSVIMWLHDRRVNGNHAKDNHYDLMNAMVHVVMMML